MITQNREYTISALAGLNNPSEAQLVLLDLIDAGKMEGTFYLNAIKTAVEVNSIMLREVRNLLESDIALFRGYDRQLSTFVNSFPKR